MKSRMTPGAKSELHSHPAVGAVGLSAGKYRFASPDGQSMEAEMSAGQVMYMDAVDHTTENVGNTKGVGILVELK